MSRTWVRTTGQTHEQDIEDKHDCMSRMELSVVYKGSQGRRKEASVASSRCRYKKVIYKTGVCVIYEKTHATRFVHVD